MKAQDPLELLAFTDPVCTWCWGSEPVLRKLRRWYGDQLHIRYLMGGLVEDIRTFYDRANAIGGDPELANGQVARHWLEASARHRMPVQTHGFRLFSAEAPSTYPQNVAYKAAELTQPGLAHRYLRRLREASAAEARETGLFGVLIELADEVGLDRSTFVRHLDDGSAERAFRADLETTRRYGVRSFPTFVLRYADEAAKLHGCPTFPVMRATIERLSGRAFEPRPPAHDPQALLDFLLVDGRAAPVELATVFDLDGDTLDRLLADLAREGRTKCVPAGNGCFWEAAGPGLPAETRTPA